MKACWREAVTVGGADSCEEPGSQRRCSVMTKASISATHSANLSAIYATHAPIKHYTVARTRGKQLDWYNLPRLVSYGGLLLVLSKGTLFRDDCSMCYFFLHHLILYLACIGFVYLVSDDVSELSTEGLEQINAYMNSMVTFTLGLYLNIVLERWWSLRVKALGEVCDSVVNVATLASVYLLGPENDIIRKLIARWSMASISLIAEASQKRDDLEELVARGILFQTEAEAIRGHGLYARPEVMWGWVMRLMTECMSFTSGPLPHANQLAVAMRECTRAQLAIKTIHTYLQTQLPFAYVHLVTLLVDLMSGVITIKCSLVTAKSLACDPPNYQDIAYQLLMFLTLPLIYFGLLSFTCVIHDPFSDHMLDFPLKHIAEYHANWCDSLLFAQEQFPSSELWAAGARAGKEVEVAVPETSAEETEATSHAAASAVLAAAMKEAMPEVVGALAGLAEELLKLHGEFVATEDGRARDSEYLISKLGGTGC